ncbi:SLBB domain-containing protein [Limnohabitans sp. Rim8]|uniref:polysaccharide biosynthesis/export family protein n=1 Tax=Limnohabitans sp. Rim8 TaxID=1100718 RepID=UPI00261FA0BB|nr:SLBB domain-containing protein [Limnohabitans sp. Rim8]
MPQRPDIGAADAQRSPMVQFRPAKPQAPSQFQRFVQESTGKLLPHFGSSLFENPLAYAADTAAPAPAEYVLGPGDEVRIQIWGGVDFAGSQTLDRSGQINLPKIGTINLSGVRVKDLEDTLRKRIATVFNTVQVNAALGKLRGITVFVVGQAQQPGTYNLTSLSTLVNAVFASGGPGVNGSMRAIELKRNGQTVTTLDLYDFIVSGDKSKDVSLQPGDVIMIPPVGPRVALTGATDHAAIYELKQGTNLQNLLSLGGGFPTLASTQKALLERIDPQNANAPRQVQNIALNAQGLAQPLRDGDVITLLPMIQAFGNVVTLQGAIAQPLRHPFTPGMRIQDLIPDRAALLTPDFFKRRNDLVQNRIAQLRARGFTPEQIQALDRAQQLPEDISLTSEIISRNNLVGQPGLFGPQGQPGQPGQALAPGQMGPQNPSLPAGQFNNNPAVNASMANSINLLTPQEQEQQLQRDREARVQRNVTDRVRSFQDQINWDYAVIERLNKNELRTQLIPFNLGKAIVQKDPAHNLELQEGDIVTIMSSAELRLPVERQTRVVRLEGEVVAPGLYQALPGETLAQIITRIGGVTPQAYLYGAEFTRESVRKQQQQNLDQLVRRLETQMQSAGATLAANLTGERALQSPALIQQQQQQMRLQIDRLKVLRSKGRVSLELDPLRTMSAATAGTTTSQILTSLPDLPLEDGDAFLVPSQPAFIAAVGSVNNENVLVYKPGKTVGDLIRSAGLTEDAKPSDAFILRADGSVLSRTRTGFFSNFESTKIMPGDTLVVPPKVDRETGYNFLVRGLRDWTQIFSNLGIGAAAIRTLRN